MSTSPANEIRTIEADGLFWVTIRMDGEALSRRGPYSSADEAESVAIQFAGICRTCNQPMSIVPALTRKLCA